MQVNGKGSKKRLQAMLKLSEDDQSLIYTASHGAYMVLIGQGCVVEVSHDEATESLLAATHVHRLMIPN